MVTYIRNLVILLMICPTFLNAQRTPHKTVVWKAKEDGIFAYFVYGLTVTTKGTVLALAEARITEGADDGAHHIVLKRSTDKGRSFSSSTILVKSRNGQSWTNPTIVQDRKTKELFLFYALNDRNAATEVFYITSKDDGISWSAPANITALFENNAHGWTFHLPGPGHGIQLKNERLLVPVWHRRSISYTAAERRYGVSCIYSDDHGKTWKAGKEAPVGEFNESQIVEQADGSVLLIGRTHSSQEGSFQAKVASYDKGISWQDSIRYDTALTGRVCDIGLVRYSMKPDRMLVSQPSDPKKRKDLVIRLSKDGSKTWPVKKLLQEGAATYSDLAVLRDKSIICLYGQGGTGHMPENVVLARFSLKWLLKDEE